ncbi:hypothetical protein D3C76_892530 [compost metagenome]
MVVTGCGDAIENSETSKSSGMSMEAPRENAVELAKADGITITANKEVDNGMFNEITVQFENYSKTFSWGNVTNETYYPIVKVADVDTDGKEEIIIILTKGYGTGLHEQEIHVLNIEGLTEMMVDDPIKSIKEKVSSKILKENGKVKVIVNFNNKEIEKTYNETDAGSWNEEVGFGSIVEYDVSDNQITATVPGSVSPAEFAVTATVEYGSDLKVKNITIKAE